MIQQLNNVLQIQSTLILLQLVIDIGLSDINDLEIYRVILLFYSFLFILFMISIHLREKVTYFQVIDRIEPIFIQFCHNYKIFFQK